MHINPSFKPKVKQEQFYGQHIIHNQCDENAEEKKKKRKSYATSFQASSNDYNSWALAQWKTKQIHIFRQQVEQHQCHCHLQKKKYFIFVYKMIFAFVDYISDMEA